MPKVNSLWPYGVLSGGGEAAGANATLTRMRWTLVEAAEPVAKWCPRGVGGMGEEREKVMAWSGRRNGTSGKAATWSGTRNRASSGDRVEIKSERKRMRGWERGKAGGTTATVTYAAHTPVKSVT